MADKEATTSEVLKLKQGFKVDGKPVNELYYNFDSVSYFLYTECNQRINRLAGDFRSTVSLFDDMSKLLYGWMTVLAAPENKELKLDWDSISLIKGADLTALSFIGQRFLVLSAQG